MRTADERSYDWNEYLQVYEASKISENMASYFPFSERYIPVDRQDCEEHTVQSHR